MTDLDTFRTETRAWLAENCPRSMRLPLEDDEDRCWGGRNWKFKSEDQKLWFARMAERGWTAPTWPKEYGGGGLSRDEARVIARRCAPSTAARRCDSFGIWMLGPALLEYGTEEQKKEYMPEITRGEIRWCQGYSEPGAGSDLACCRRAREDKGDHFLVNGQKVWTSLRRQSRLVFCLVRTDRGEKHEGISFVLIDMASPGVETRPIQLISGESPFCETFFNDVNVPKGNLVGELNRAGMSPNICSR